MHLIILIRINLIFLLIIVIIRIAFYTLLERKLIGYSQSRKGPNKAAIAGLVQPMADAIKLLTKEMTSNVRANKIAFILAPLFNILCSLTIWIVLPQRFRFIKLSLLFIMRCMRLNLISIITIRWASNSNYAYIGIIRTISQMVSYEVNFILIIIILINLNEELNLSTMFKIQQTTPIIILSFPLVIIWIITSIAETNRTPFDFSEGESELVSGFNIEYSSVEFIILFLAEYCRILLIRIISSIIFIKFMPHETPFYFAYTSFYVIFIWSRATLPRFRYDKLIKLNWTQILPATTTCLMLSFIIKLY